MAELLLSRFAGTSVVFLASSVGVALSVWYGGLWPGVLATAVAVIATDYVFYGPGALLQFGSLVAEDGVSATESRTVGSEEPLPDRAVSLTAPGPVRDAREERPPARRPRPGYGP